MKQNENDLSHRKESTPVVDNKPNGKSHMKTKNALRGISIAVAMQLGMLAASAQTNIYLTTGYETNITLAAGTYNITAYGAQGGTGSGGSGGLGAEMGAQFSFTQATNLTLLVGGTGVSWNSYGGGGGGGSFVAVSNSPLIVAGGGGGGGYDNGGGNGQTTTNGSGQGGGPGGSNYGSGGGGGFNGDGIGGGWFYPGANSIAGPGGQGGSSFLHGGTGGTGGGYYAEGPVVGGYGGGGGGAYWAGGGGGGYDGGAGSNSGFSGAPGGDSYIDSSAVATIAEVSGIASPDDSTGNGEIIITTVPTPPTIGIATVNNLPVVIWPASATNFVLQMSTNLNSGNWVNVSNGIPFVGLQITNASGNAFFRLY